MQKDCVLKLRIAEKDAAAIRAKAAELGMSVSAFVRDAALGRQFRRPRRTLVELDFQDGMALLDGLAQLSAMRRSVGDTPATIALAEGLEAMLARIGRE